MGVLKLVSLDILGIVLGTLLAYITIAVLHFLDVFPDLYDDARVNGYVFFGAFMGGIGFPSSLAVLHNKRAKKRQNAEALSKHQTGVWPSPPSNL